MMPLSEIFFIGIVCYLLYRFIFNFLMPVVRTTRHVRQQFRNMQDMSQNQGSPFQGPHSPYDGQQGGARSNGAQANGPRTGSAQTNGAQPRKPGPQANNTMGEYIDFEEIK